MFLTYYFYGVFSSLVLMLLIELVFICKTREISYGLSLTDAFINSIFWFIWIPTLVFILLGKDEQ